MNEEEIKNGVTFIKEFKHQVELIVQDLHQAKDTLHVNDWESRRELEVRAQAIDFSIKSVPSGASTSDEIVARAEKFANFISKEKKND